ncbi:hypothetical protein ACHAXR_001822 [Thalassiosira sp. AJA248-18]
MNKSSSTRFRLHCSVPFAISIACTAYLLVVWRMNIFSEGGSNAMARKGVMSGMVNKENGQFALALSQSFGFFDDITDEHWRLLQKIYFDHVNHKYPDKPLTNNPAFDKRTHGGWNSPHAWYQNNYEPNFPGCQFEKRIGQNMNGDGPKWICDPHRIKKLAAARKAKDPTHPGCVVYSVGSSGDFNFEMGLQNELGAGVCEYHIFDMGDYGAEVPKELERAHYHKWGLAKQRSNTDKPQPGKTYYGLLDTVKLLGHEQLDVIDIFKIDCEKCEWDTYKDRLADGIPMLHQIQVEVHEAPGQKAIDFFDFLERTGGYLRFHKEPNIQWDPDCIEYAFVKVDEAFAKGKKFENKRGR